MILNGESFLWFTERGLQDSRVIHYAKQAPWNHKITAVAMLWRRYVRQNLKRSRFSYAANRRCFLFSLLRIPIVFNIVYAIPFLINKKAYMKRKIQFIWFFRREKRMWSKSFE